MSSQKNHRYPGTVPFTDTPHDRQLFFGREAESQRVLHKILGNKLLVLFAKSGIGKTSLLNIGVSQPLRDNGFVPLPIRLNQPDKPLLDSFYAAIDALVAQQRLDHQPGDSSRLWHYFNTVEFWSEDDQLLTPVLIFDQFEEIFSLHSQAERQVFITQLAELIQDKVPTTVRASSSDKSHHSAHQQIPAVKIVIAIREDYLAYLDELSRQIPEILHNRFRLLPLSRKSARQAIEKPAALQSDSLDSAVFAYDSAAVESMLDFLAMRHERGKVVASDAVESFQLQLLCSHLESLLQQKTGDRLITTADLDGEQGMRTVLKQFYQQQLNRVGISQRNKIRRLCESGLISPKNNRLSLALEVIEQEFEVSETLLNTLVESRLLHTEQRLGSIHYELSHDTLIKPIRDAQGKLQVLRRVKAGAFGLLLAVITGIGGYEYKKRVEKHSEGYVSQGDYHVSQVSGYISKKGKDIGQAGKGIRQAGKGIRQAGKGIRQAGIETWQESKSGDYKEAIVAYKKALSIDEQNDQAYIQLAIAYIQQGKPDSAIEVYGQALEVSSALAGIFVDIGKALERESPERESLDKELKQVWLTKLYELAAGVEGESKYYYFDLGERFVEQGKYDVAIQQYKKALENDPEYVNAYYAMGFALYRVDKYDEAVEQYKKVLEISPECVGCAGVYDHIGFLLYKRGEYDEAIKHYKKALKIAPEFIAVYNGIGLALGHQGKYDEAVAEYQKALKIEPELKWAQANLAYFHLMAGKSNQAFERALKLLQDDDLPIHGQFGVDVTAVTALLLQDKTDRVKIRTVALISAFEAQNKEIPKYWDYQPIKDFINNHRQLTSTQGKFLLTLIDLLEGSIAERESKIKVLKAQMAKLVSPR